ncbi:hypothetical protein FHG87_019223 [Trinorchestia longiramus]|nr:hypothetical protein FHG87_019223 [Trinorchestia longiramus]
MNNGRQTQRQQVRRAAMNDVQREEYCEQQRSLSPQRRENMVEEQQAQYLERQKKLFQLKEQNMNEEDKMNSHQNQRERYEQRFENMNPGEVNYLRQNQLQKQRIRRNEPVLDIANIIDIEPFDIGEMNVRYEYCDALRFRNDKNCCHNGKVSVPALQPYPEALRDLLQGNDQKSTSFRKNIKNYNCVFSFASFGVKLCVPPGRGLNCFRIQGQTYHTTTYLYPGDGQPQYGQLYIVEANLTPFSATDNHMRHFQEHANSHM